ncbi:MarR family winged helix-turn-helix transcriptional regulator [Enterococcus sp. BWR-S5]|uniref:MarR family winged helix-turn-helix transcriptional regulator n=1 Tax=Enterococcus sp. BWR-S5 TaxID=2787714 RepID=UPI001921F097|nr:MarR family transcriptional regulator [Enterococcus sp. BWR-S5]MBL1226628.1 MarR family transcriptional regulator [Enterococcus sp. BWR-S5]
MEKQQNVSLANWLDLSQMIAVVDSEMERQLKENVNLALNEFYVLHFLSIEESKKMRLQHLEERVGLSQSALSRLISRMEDKRCGVINRHVCTDDKRGIYISITDKGLKKLVEAEKVADGVLKQAVQQYPLLTDFYRTKT